LRSSPIVSKKRRWALPKVQYRVGSIGSPNTPMPIAPPFTQFDFLMVDRHVGSNQHYALIYASLTVAPFAVNFVKSLPAYIGFTGGPCMPVGYAQSFTAATSTGNKRFRAQYIKIAMDTVHPNQFDMPFEIG
jgi:hypothetical protein